MAHLSLGLDTVGKEDMGIGQGLKVGPPIYLYVSYVYITGCLNQIPSFPPSGCWVFASLYIISRHSLLALNSVPFTSA